MHLSVILHAQWTAKSAHYANLMIMILVTCLGTSEFTSRGTLPKRFDNDVIYNKVDVK